MKSFVARTGKGSTQETQSGILGRKWLSGTDLIFGDDYRFTGEDLNSIIEDFSEKFPNKLKDSVEREMRFQKKNSALSEGDRQELVGQLESLYSVLNIDDAKIRSSLERVAKRAILSQLITPFSERPVPETRRNVLEWIQRTAMELGKGKTYEPEPMLAGISSRLGALSDTMLYQLGDDYYKQIEREANQLSGRNF